MTNDPSALLDDERATAQVSLPPAKRRKLSLQSSAPTSEHSSSSPTQHAINETDQYLPSICGPVAATADSEIPFSPTMHGQINPFIGVAAAALFETTQEHDLDDNPQVLEIQRSIPQSILQQTVAFDMQAAPPLPLEFAQFPHDGDLDAKFQSSITGNLYAETMKSFSERKRAKLSVSGSGSSDSSLAQLLCPTALSTSDKNGDGVACRRSITSTGPLDSECVDVGAESGASPPTPPPLDPTPRGDDDFDAEETETEDENEENEEKMDGKNAEVDVGLETVSLEAPASKAKRKPNRVVLKLLLRHGDIVIMVSITNQSIKTPSTFR